MNPKRLSTQSAKTLITVLALASLAACGSEPAKVPPPPAPAPTGGPTPAWPTHPENVLKVAPDGATPAAEFVNTITSNTAQTGMSGTVERFYSLQFDRYLWLRPGSATVVTENSEACKTFHPNVRFFFAASTGGAAPAELSVTGLGYSEFSILPGKAYTLEVVSENKTECKIESVKFSVALVPAPPVSVHGLEVFVGVWVGSGDYSVVPGTTLPSSVVRVEIDRFIWQDLEDPATHRWYPTYTVTLDWMTTLNVASGAPTNAFNGRLAGVDGILYQECVNKGVRAMPAVGTLSASELHINALVDSSCNRLSPELLVSLQSDGNLAADLKTAFGLPGALAKASNLVKQPPLVP